MNREINPELFIDKVNEVGMEAKKATIELLKSQGERCFVVNFEDFDNYEVYTGDDYFVTFQAVGLDMDDNLIIGGTRKYLGEGSPLLDFEASFQDTDCMALWSYPELYAFVAKHIADDAMTHEEAEELLEGYTDDEM